VRKNSRIFFARAESTSSPEGAVEGNQFNGGRRRETGTRINAHFFLSGAGRSENPALLASLFWNLIPHAGEFAGNHKNRFTRHPGIPPVSGITIIP
jgi:hypothetical protein